MKPLVLDAEALSALTGGDSPRKRTVRRICERATALNRPVMVPAVVLAELYRGRQHNRALDSFLAREDGAIDIRQTDRPLARYVGAVLAAAGAGSELMADAHVIAIAVEMGGGVVLTADPGDMERLAAAYPDIVVDAI